MGQGQKQGVPISMDRKNVRGQKRGSQGGKIEKPDLPLHEEKESFKVRIIMHLTEQNKRQ